MVRRVIGFLSCVLFANPSCTGFVLPSTKGPVPSVYTATPDAPEAGASTVAPSRHATWHRYPKVSTPSIQQPSSKTVLHSLPPIQNLVAACLAPSLSGYYKNEYAVSYAYGTAVAACAWMIRQSLPGSSCLASWHSLALLFYGLRLNTFLLYRETCIPYFREMREKIESVTKERYSNRLARTPFILGVSFLYINLVAPIWMTAQSSIMTTTPMWSTSGGVLANVFRFGILSTWIGFGVAALGDLTKSWMKARKGAETLVTGGIFKWLRHPNYTGEMIGWTSSMFVAVLATIVTASSSLPLVRKIPAVTAAGIGASGIGFVLIGAGTGLERRQLERYGNTTEYQEWVKTSWPGVILEDDDADNSLEDDDDDDDDDDDIDDGSLNFPTPEAIKKLEDMLGPPEEDDDFSDADDESTIIDA